MSRKAWYFLGLTFALTWLIEGVAILWIVDFDPFNQVGPGPGTITLILAFCMYVPTVAAVIVQKGLYDDPLTPLGLSMSPNGWWGVAVLLPLGVALLSLGASALLPGVEFSSGKPFLLDMMEHMPPDEAEEARRHLKEGKAPPGLELGLPLALVLFGAALVFGPINGIAAFGEEFGWRGFLQKELAPLGFWRSSLLIGVIWGVWHLPIIASGYNYPGAPILGPAMLTAFTTAWSPLLAYLVVQGRSVVPAAICHGTISTTIGAGLIFLTGGGRLTVGLIGLPGILVVGAANGILWWHQLQNQKAFDEAWMAFRRVGEEAEAFGETPDKKASF